MLFFVVPSCTVKACQNWRIDNHCVKDNMHIATASKYIANMHDGGNCEVRKQIDVYRLENMLGE